MNNINIKNHYQNIFLFLVPFIALILFIPLSYGELNMSDSGSVVTYGLLLPEYKVDISQYNDTKEILVDVKFQNKKKSFTGISDNWLTVEEGQTPQQVYDDYVGQRLLVVYIDNLTNSKKQPIDQDDMKVSSNSDFLEFNGNGLYGKNAFEIEILNIDDLVDLSTNFNDALEFQIKISSDKFFPENKYELLIGTWTRDTVLTETAIFTLPDDLTNTREQKEEKKDTNPQQATPKIKQEDKSEQNLSDLQQQQLEQQQRAIAEAEQRKQQREAEQKEFELEQQRDVEQKELEKLQEENKKLEIILENIEPDNALMETQLMKKNKSKKSQNTSQSQQITQSQQRRDAVQELSLVNGILSSYQNRINPRRKGIL